MGGDSRVVSAPSQEIVWHYSRETPLGCKVMLLLMEAESSVPQVQLIGVITGIVISD